MTYNSVTIKTHSWSDLARKKRMKFGSSETELEEDEQLKKERIKSYIIYLFGPRLLRDVYNSKG